MVILSCFQLNNKDEPKFKRQKGKTQFQTLSKIIEILDSFKNSPDVWCWLLITHTCSYLLLFFFSENQGIDDPSLYFEGDMILTPEQRYRAEHGKPVFGSNRRKRGASTFALWPLGVLVYEIDPSLGEFSVKPSQILVNILSWRLINLGLCATA